MSNFYSNRQATLFQHNPFAQSIQITPCAGGANVRTPYSAKFVDEMKAAVPFAHRTWDGNLKVWRISSAYISEICRIIEKVYGYCPDVEIAAEDNSFESQTYLLEYIGRAKERSAGTFESKIDTIFVGSERSGGRKFLQQLSKCTGGISVCQETEKLHFFRSEFKITAQCVN